MAEGKALRKDQSLVRLASIGNVAQFVAFAPDSRGGAAQTHARLLGHPDDHEFDGVEQAAATLLAAAPEGKVNVRSFAPNDPRSREFVYGLETVAGIAANAQRLLVEGLHVILNETVDVGDGGVSGAVQDGIIEFAPDDTPRCVEKPGTVSLPLDLGLRLLETVYGFRPDLPPSGGRVEFSVHPQPRGVRHGHTLLWEYERHVPDPGPPALAWPNRFSRHLGDKLFGLLMADLAGLPVPATTAICRRVAPFRFGKPTGSAATWTRTCPVEQEPGLYTTVRGWIDPFKLLAAEDPDGGEIASVLSQAAVLGAFSGAAITAADGSVAVEGVLGAGDLFMLGDRLPEPLPAAVVDDIRALVARATATFGPVRLEWVHDGVEAWVVQMHAGATGDQGSVIVPGEPESWVRFEVSRGLPALRLVLAALGEGRGLLLAGDFGRTSHLADLVRKAGRPARIERC